MSVAANLVEPGFLRIRALPGVWRPHSDAGMVARLVAEDGLAPGADVLDVFTGSGVLAVAAARLGARSVTAVDLSRRALLSARLNAWHNGVSVRALRSDLFAALGDATFDLILANPPYYPGERRPRRGLQRAWHGGQRGRALIDPLCAQAPLRLRPGGRLLLVHATFNGEDETLHALRAAGLRAQVVHRHRGPWGAVGRARLGSLREFADDEEETIVICATRDAP